MALSEITVGHVEWKCCFSFTDKSRIKAFRKVLKAISEIADPSYRICPEALQAAYDSLASWDRRGANRHTSPSFTHQPASRAWFLDIKRV